MDGIFEKIDTYKGYKYAIWLNTRAGYRCGYVFIPEDSCIYNMFFRDIDITYVELTYSGKLKDINGWCIGWDHNHLWDGTDEEAIIQHNQGKTEDELYEMIEYARSFHDYGGYSPVYSCSDVEKECFEVINEVIHLEGI